MKGKLNVAEVNCAELQALCKAEDVRGFPSLILCVFPLLQRILSRITDLYSLAKDITMVVKRNSLVHGRLRACKNLWKRLSQSEYPTIHMRKVDAALISHCYPDRKSKSSKRPTSLP